MASPELKVRVLADIKKFTSQMKNVQSQVKAVGKGVARAGKMISAVATTSITAFGVTSLRAFDQQAKAEAQLRSALIANGRQVNELFSDYAEFATALQRVTTVGDESTLGMIQVAESMGLTGEQAKRSVKNAIGLSKAFGMNEQSAIRYTAALEEGDATMLRRYIPALRQIEDESEMVAKAQELLGNMFQTATAEAESGLGPLQQMKNSFGDLQEDLGAVVAEAIIPLADRLKEFFELMQQQTPETKKRFVLLATAVAGLGPALIGLGIAMQFVVSPITLIGVGIAGLVVLFDYTRRNAEAFKNGFVNIFQNMKLQVLLRIREMMVGMEGLFSKLGIDILEGPISKIDEMILDTAEQMKKTAEGSELQSFQDYWKEVGGDLKSFVLDIMAIPPAVERASKAIQRLPKPDPIQELGTEEFDGEQAPRFRKVDVVEVSPIPTITDQMMMLSQMSEVVNQAFMQLGQGISQAFGQAIVFGESLSDTLDNILKQLASRVLQRLFTVVLTGATGGIGGIFGKIGGALFGGVGMAQGGVVPRGFPNDSYPALLTSGEMVVPKPHALPSMGGAVEVFGEFRVRGSDLVTAISNTNNRTLR